MKTKKLLTHFVSKTQWCEHNNKKFELMLTRRAKANSSSGSR